MKLFHVVKKGFNKIQMPRILAAIYLINLLFSICILAPFSVLTHKLLHRSLEAEAVLSDFNPYFIGDFFSAYSDYLSSFGVILALFAILYAILWIFLNGGILHILSSDTPRSLARFLDGCAYYFIRLFLLFLISLIFYAAFVVFPYLAMNKLIFWIINSSESPLLATVLGLLKYLIALMLFWFINMVFDYAKIEAVDADVIKPIHSTRNSLLFALSNLTSTYPLYLILSLVSIAAYLIFNMVTSIFHPESLIPIVLLFLVQQIYIFIKICIRALYLASERELYLWNKHSY